MNVSSRIARTLILGLALGAIATGPSPASQLQVVPGTPPVSVLPKPAKYTGTHGLRVAITDASPAYVQDNSPLNEATYIVRFYVNVNGIKMATDDALDLIQAFDADGADTGGVPALRVELKNPASGRALNVCARDNGSGEKCLTDTSDEVPVAPAAPFANTRGWNAIEIKFTSDHADANDGNNNGIVEVWVNGKKVVVDAGLGINVIDNDVRLIDYVRMGATAGIDAGMIDATGPTVANEGSTLRFDDFVSQRANYVGPITAVFTDATNPADGFWGGVMSVYGAEITTGASCPGTCTTSPCYCGTANTSRQQMAIFLERGMKGGLHNPPACTPGTFNDINCSDPTFHPWITELFADGVTAGATCAATCPTGPCYCPTADVARRQMAIFLLRAKYGPSYVPPSCVGSLPAFNDVACTGTPADATFTNWIYKLRDDGITTGASCAATCAVGPCYCPVAPVARRQMALFLQRAFGLPLWQVGP